jgi:hypothetical protein
VKGVVEGYKTANIPLEAMWIDIDLMENYKVFFVLPFVCLYIFMTHSFSSENPSENMCAVLFFCLDICIDPKRTLLHLVLYMSSLLVLACVFGLGICIDVRISVSVYIHEV